MPDSAKNIFNPYMPGYKDDHSQRRKYSSVKIDSYLATQLPFFILQVRYYYNWPNIS